MVSEEEKDRAVEEALYRRAVGYKATDVQVETADGKEKRRETTSDVPGDLRAQMFWLRNRRPDRWKDKPCEDEDKQEGGVRIVDDVP